MKKIYNQKHSPQKLYKSKQILYEKINQFKKWINYISGS